MKGKTGPIEGFGPVHCSSVSLCWSTSVNGTLYDQKGVGKPVSITRQTWSTTTPLSGDRTVATAPAGAVASSTDPSGPVGSWHAKRTLPATGDSGNPLVSQPLTFTACPSADLCFAGAPANVDGERMTIRLIPACCSSLPTPPSPRSGSSSGCRPAP